MDSISFSFTDCGHVLDEKELEAKMTKSAEVLETALCGEIQYRSMLGWLAIDTYAGSTRLDYLEREAMRIRADADAFVVIGVGGSNQASRAVIEALHPLNAPVIFWAGNTLSAYEMQQMLNALDGYSSIYINCIAKNFETLEPGIAFRILRQYLEKRYGCNAHRRIYATGTPGSTLDQLCKDNGYTFLTFPERIGGRFSVGSDVGMFPMAVAGINIQVLTEGMRVMRNRICQESAVDNIALRYACLRKLMLDHGYKIEMLSFFEPRLNYFSKWWIQLFAESEGKQGTALYPVAASYSEDLHSIGQFVQQGSPILFETFIQVLNQDSNIRIPKERKKDYFDYLDNKTLWGINQIAQEATISAHCDRGIPCLKITVTDIDEFSFGQLFYYFMFSCYLSSKLLGVNPFNQPGVEKYKKYILASLKKP